MSAPHASPEPRDLKRVVSHGRGGAGNIGEDSGTMDQNGLPHLTSAVYTTGRGGTGNMAMNDPSHPEIARLAQDVEVPLHRPLTNEFHGGRGGAGNVYHPEDEQMLAAHLREQREQEEEEKAQKSNKPPPVDHSKIDYRGWADRGKDLLFGRKNKSSNKD